MANQNSASSLPSLPSSLPLEAQAAEPSYQTQDLFGGAIQVSLPTTFQDLSSQRPVPDHQECWFEAKGGDRLLVIEIVERPDDDKEGGGEGGGEEEMNNNKQNNNKQNDPVEFYFCDLCHVNDIPRKQHVYHPGPRHGDCHGDCHAGGNDDDDDYRRLFPFQLPSLVISGQRPEWAELVFFGTGWHTLPTQQQQQQQCTSVAVVEVELCLIRLPTVHADILISLSTPTTVSIASLSKQQQEQQEQQEQEQQEQEQEQEQEQQEEKWSLLLKRYADSRSSSSSSDVFQRVVSTFDIRDWSLFGEEGQGA